MKLKLFGLLMVVVLLAACGGDDDSDDQSGGGGSGTEPVATNSIDVTLSEYEFSVDGEASAGPLTINFTNGGGELHHAILGKLGEGKTMEDVQALLEKNPEGDPPPWFDDSPPDLTLLSSGNSGGLVIDAEEGTYVLLCFMPDPKGEPHVSHGMAKTFDVGAAGDAEAPEPDDSVSMTEEGPEAPELPSGPSVLEVTNDAEEPGEYFVVQLAEGKEIADIDTYFQGGAKGDSPASFFGGTHQFEPGESVTVALDLEPGEYSLVSSYGEDDNIVDTPVEFTVE